MATNAVEKKGRSGWLILAVIAASLLVHPLAGAVVAGGLAIANRARILMIALAVTLVVIALVLTPTISLGAKFKESGSSVPK